MRTVQYRRYWSYLGAAEHQDTLVGLILDIPYLMEGSGVIPPLMILNQILQSGGDTGGMGPGTMWQPFQIDNKEYKELVQAFLKLNIEQARQEHPYISFDKVTVDPELAQCTDHIEWLEGVQAKYSSGE